MSASRRRVYAELLEDEYGNKVDARFLPHLSAKPGVPRKAVALAVLLFCVGALFLFLGALSLGGHMHIDPRKGTHREMALAFTVLGSMTFIPGAYYTRVAYCAYRGYAGYSYRDIPYE